jgi:hypothetical protein
MKKRGRKEKPNDHKMVQKGVSLSPHQWEQLGQNASYQIRQALDEKGIKIEKVNISS